MIACQAGKNTAQCPWAWLETEPLTNRRPAHQPLTTAPPSLFMKVLKAIFVYFLICRSCFNFRRQIFAPGSRIQCRRTWVTSGETMTPKCTFLSKYYHVRVTIATSLKAAGRQLRFGLRTCSRSLTSIWKYCLRCHGELIGQGDTLVHL